MSSSVDQRGDEWRAAATTPAHGPLSVHSKRVQLYYGPASHPAKLPPTSLLVICGFDRLARGLVEVPYLELACRAASIAMQLTRSGIRPAGARGVQQRAAFGALRRCCAASARGRPTARAVPPEQQPDATPSPLDAASGSSSSAGLGASTGAGEAAAPPPRLPTFDDGISWYCYTALTLLFLVDFTPLGAFLAAGPDAPLKLAAFQGAAFFAPSLAHAVKQRWDLGRTFNVGAPSAKWLAAGESSARLICIAD